MNSAKAMRFSAYINVEQINDYLFKYTFSQIKQKNSMNELRVKLCESNMIFCHQAYQTHATLKIIDIDNDILCSDSVTL